jgi:hypothetical protein
MPFQPNVHDELTIDGVTYRIAEHPAAPGIPYGQEGRAGIVYLEPSPSPAGRERGPGGEGSKAALKVFKPRFRLPFLVAQADRMAPFAALPGLRACQRTVLTPFRHADLLRQHPDLTYAVLMPWIEGPTWFDILMGKKLLPPQTSLDLARSLAQVLARMEEQGIAHCDLSGPNVMLPLLAGGTGVELVDLEGLYAPGMTRPQELSSGSAGYAQKQVAGGLWAPEADRFAGAVLLAEMLGWCDPQVVQAAWGESYFDPREMQQDCPRYRILMNSLQHNWGSRTAALFQQAWHSDTMTDCPTFGEWLVILPEQIPTAEESPAPDTGQGTSPGPDETTLTEVRTLIQAGNRLREKGLYEGAQEIYRQARELAAAEPGLASLAHEITLTMQDLEARQRELPPPTPVQARPTVREAPRSSPRQTFLTKFQPLWTNYGGILWGWVLFTVLGWSLYGAVHQSVYLAIYSRLWLTGFSKAMLSLALWSAMGGIVGGAVAGIGQWLELRRFVRGAWWWILTVITGLAAGGAVRWALSSITSMKWYYFLCWMAIGAITGIWQWQLLRPHVRHAGWWIPFYTVTFAIGWLTVSEPTHWGTYQIYLHFYNPPYPTQTLSSAAGGAILGGLISLGLWYALRRYVRASAWWILPIIFGLIALGTLNEPMYRDAHEMLNRIGTVDWSIYRATIGAICGIFVGLGQWMLLRQHIRWAGVWILLSGITVAVSEAAAENIYSMIHLTLISPVYLVKNWSLYLPLYWATVSATIGLTSGIGVWLILRQHAPQASRWIWGSAIALMMVGAAVGTLIRGMNLAITGALAGILAGIPTGIVLMWLLHRTSVLREQQQR